MTKGTGKGLLLDLDGTLADSLDALKATYFSFLEGYGAKGNDAEFTALNGVPLVTIIDRLKAKHDLADATDALLARYAKLIEVAHRSAKPAAGAATVLEISRARGWRVAVVTSTPHWLAMNWIARAGLRTLIDAVVGGDDVSSGKPSPEPYILALTRLDGVAARSLAVEDSPLGAQAAVAAGIPTLAIAHPDAQGEWPFEMRFIGRFSDIANYL